MIDIGADFAGRAEATRMTATIWSRPLRWPIPTTGIGRKPPQSFGRMSALGVDTALHEDLVDKGMLMRDEGG